MTTPQSATPPRKRRWYQFSLRTLLIVMLLSSVGMSWFAVKLQQARRQREAVAAIREAGGGVMYDYKYYVNEFSTAVESEPPGPEWLRELLGEDFFSDVLYVRFGPTANDEMLKQIVAMPKVKGLDLADTQVTDAGLVYLEQQTRLSALYLDGTHVTEEGLATLHQALPNCRIYGPQPTQPKSAP